MKTKRNYSLFCDKSWAFRHFDGRRREFRGWSREEFEAMRKKHWERAGRSVPTSQYIYEARRREIAYFSQIPYEYQGDGMDDYNKYQRPASNGVGYVAICPGERANNHYVDDPILVAYLTKKFNKHCSSPASKIELSYHGKIILLKSYFLGPSEKIGLYKFRVVITCCGKELPVAYNKWEKHLCELDFMQLLGDVCYDALMGGADYNTFAEHVARNEVTHSLSECKRLHEYFKSISVDPSKLGSLTEIYTQGV